MEPQVENKENTPESLALPKTPEPVNPRVQSLVEENSRSVLQVPASPMMKKLGFGSG